MTLLQAPHLQGLAPAQWRKVFTACQGLDTTGKLPVAPKSLGLPGKGRENMIRQWHSDVAGSYGGEREDPLTSENARVARCPSCLRFEEKEKEKERPKERDRDRGRDRDRAAALAASDPSASLGLGP